MGKKYNSQYGIKTGFQLACALRDLKTAVYLNFQSFDEDVSNTRFCGYQTYSDTRDIALKNLTLAGFNAYEENEPTRMALINAPFTQNTLKEVFDIYKFANERNMYVVSCPTSLSGKGLDAYEKERGNDWKEFVNQIEIEYSKIYEYAIKTGLMSYDEFINDGAHIYAGAHPCNQVAAGMYLQLSGQVVQCPGRICPETTFTNDIRKSGLKKVWKNSPNAKLAKHGEQFNCRCIARDGISLPRSFYDNITKLTLERLA
jgi:hypothetical protein